MMNPVATVCVMVAEWIGQRLVAVDATL